MTDQIPLTPASGLARIAAAALAAPMSIVAVRRAGRLRLAGQHGAGAPAESLDKALGECELCTRALREDAPVAVPDGQTQSGRVTRLLGAGSCVAARFPDAAGVEGLVLVLDTEPRIWGAAELGLAAEFAATAAASLARAGDGEAEEIRRYAAEMARLFEGLPEGVALMAPDGRVVRVNRAFAEMFGYSAEEVAGRPLTGLIIPEDRRGELAAVDAEVLDGRSVALETVRVRKDGSSVHVSVLGTPMELDSGEMGICKTFRDITAQKRAEAELAAAEAHYRRLFESSPVGIFAIDMDGRFTEVNPAAESMAGRPASELVGTHFSEVVAPEDLELARERTDRMYAGEMQADEFDLQLVRPGGERRLIRTRFSPIREGDELRGVHGVGRDVTEERARTGYMHRAERLATIETLLSGVAHELNNPLNAIRNFAQLMLLDERGEDDREALEIIQNEADRAAKIVADLRLIARQTRETEGDRELVDLNEVVAHVLKLRRYTLETHNIRIHENLAPNLPAVLGNREELEQVLLNLLLNAEDALADQGGERSVSVSTRRAANGVHLQVGDSGPGIPAADLERVFEPFWTTKSPGAGTGLGLSLVHRIVTDHGGEVRARNEPGSGAVFTLVLPRATEHIEADEIVPAGEPLRPLRVLLVDDEAPIRTSIARYLRRRGHHADEARDGSEALAMLSDAADYDVILTDLRMPGLGGEQLLERLRASGGDLHRKVIVITGDAAHADAASIVAATGAPTLIKPVGLHEVARAVEEHAERIHSRENGSS